MRVRYGKPIKVKSLFGLQNNSTANISNTNRYFRTIIATNTFEMDSGIYNNSLYKGASISNEDYLFLVVETTIEASNFGTCYFTQNTTVNYTSLTEYKIGNIIVIKQKLSTSSSSTDTYHFRLSQPTQVTYKVNYAFLLNASDLNLDNLTAQEFYNKYNKYFSLIATGEEITIDDKAGQIAYKNLEEDSIRCKVAGGSSDIYYGYNSIFDFSASIWTNDNVDTFTMTKTADKLSFECYTAGSRNNKGITNNILVVASHKYLLSYDILSTVSYNLDISGNTVNTATVINMYPTSVVANELTNVQMIVQAQNNLTWRMGRGSVTVAVGDTIEFSNIYIIDLTDWFGAGKEPSTVAKFKEQFTKEYYGFCKTPIKLTRYQIEALPSYDYNQLINSTFEFNITLSSADTTSSNWWKYPTYTWKLPSAGYMIKGHKYLGLKYSNLPDDIIVVRNAGHAENMTGFFTWGSTTSSATVGIFKLNNQTIPAGDYYIGYNCIDLTDWYGAGNEPTTLSEFKATFPNKYYPYSKKRLLNKYMINKLIN